MDSTIGWEAKKAGMWLLAGNHLWLLPLRDERSGVGEGGQTKKLYRCVLLADVIYSKAALTWIQHQSLG